MKKFKNKNLTASSKNWITRQFNDPYSKLAKEKGYRSRSAFKLIEINNKFKFLKNNLNILELGSAPGGWSQVCAQINKNGKNLSIDILNMETIDNIFFFKKNKSTKQVPKSGKPQKKVFNSHPLFNFNVLIN